MTTTCRIAFDRETAFITGWLFGMSLEQAVKSIRKIREPASRFPDMAHHRTQNLYLLRRSNYANRARAEELILPEAKKSFG
jgi:hypothetical protein